MFDDCRNRSIPGRRSWKTRGSRTWKSPERITRLVKKNCLETGLPAVHYFTIRYNNVPASEERLAGAQVVFRVSLAMSGSCGESDCFWKPRNPTAWNKT